MALRISQGAAMNMVGSRLLVYENSTDFALVSGGASADTITRSTGDFTTLFKEGDMLYVMGATDTDDDIAALITDVAALTITLNVGDFTTGQSSGTEVTLAVARCGSIPNIFNGGTLYIYNGTRPTAAADDIGAASQLVSFTNLQFGDATWDATESKAYVEATGLSAVVGASGTATWGRLVAPGDNATGSSTTAKRLDVSVGINTGDFQMKAVALNTGETITVSSWKIQMPTGV